MSREHQAIIAEYAARGIEAVSGKGGFWLRDGGFRSLARARKETSINMAQKRDGERVSAYGDWATLALLNGAR